MSKLKIYLADQDKYYCEKFVFYVLNNYKKFEISYFDNTYDFENAIKNQCNADILLFTNHFICESILNIKNTIKILFKDNEEGNIKEHFYGVEKYQKAEDIINEILTCFVKQNGKNYFNNYGQKFTIVTSIFSAIGGSGKTSIALALSKMAVTFGHKVLYMSFDHFNSTNLIFGASGDRNLTNIFFSIKNNENLEFCIKENISTDDNTKIDFISPLMIVSENKEVENEEIALLINEIKKMSSYDFVFIDTVSDFSDRTLEIIKASDNLFNIFLQDNISLGKFYQFLNEIKIQNMVEIDKKISNILNKWDGMDFDFEYEILAKIKFNTDIDLKNFSQNILNNEIERNEFAKIFEELKNSNI